MLATAFEKIFTELFSLLLKTSNIDPIYVAIQVTVLLMWGVLESMIGPSYSTVDASGVEEYDWSKLQYCW